MHELIAHHFSESANTKLHAADILSDTIIKTTQCLTDCLLNDKKILTCGNGHSIGDAQRFVSILLHRLINERPALPAVSLCSDTATITAIANNSSFNEIFSKQIRALGQQGDVLLALSITGNCSNIVQAVQAAHDKEMKVVHMTGKKSGNISTLLSSHDIEIKTPSNNNIRIQEVHNLIINCICDLIDQQLFGFQSTN